jgi:predicted GNAT family acetyltransferase
VFTESAARDRGWGKSVVSALVSELLKSGRMPLYVVNEQNTASINLATSIGFVDTGTREYAGQVVLSQ